MTDLLAALADAIDRARATHQGGPTHLIPVPDPEPVHLRHSIDGYPLCWPMDRDGDFTATDTEADVTCDDCLHHLREDQD